MRYVAGYYLLLCPLIQSIFHWKLFGDLRCLLGLPSSLGVLRWGGFLLRILILWKRCISMIDWCLMGKQNGENADHLLLHCPMAHCPMASEMWSFVFFSVWYPLGYTSTGYGSASLMTRGFGRHPNAAIWKIVPHCLIWYIWQERNARNFEGCEWSIIELKSFFLFSLLDSDRALQAFSCDSFSDLLVRAIFVEMLMCIPGSFADLIKIVIKKKITGQKPHWLNNWIQYHYQEFWQVQTIFKINKH